MNPARLDECLAVVRWTPEMLAECLGCDVSLVNAWLSGEAEIPMKAGEWIALFATVVQTAETRKPVALKGKRYKPLSNA